MRPVPQLERDVMHHGLRALDEIYRVVVGIAAQEDEKILHPVRNPKTKHAFVEVRDRFWIGHEKRQVSELVGSDANDLMIVTEIVPLREQLDRRALGIMKRQHARRTRRTVAALLARNSLPRQLAAQVVEVGLRSDLERQLGAASFRAERKFDRELADLRCEKGLVLLAPDEREPVDLRVIVDLPLEIGCVETRVSDAADLDHDLTAAQPGSE